MKRIIGVNSNCYHGFSVEEAIDGIAAAGFRYIELTATKGWTEHVFPDQSFHRLWQVKERLEEQFQQSGPAEDAAGLAEGEDYPLQDVLSVLRDMGLYEDLVNTIDQAVQDGMTAVAANAAAAVAAAIAQSVAYTVIFTVAFALILIAWKVFSHAVDLVAKLPGLNFLNKTGGAAMGLLKGVLILFLAAWLIQYSGKLIPEETVQQTHLLKFFMTTNPMTLLQGL